MCGRTACNISVANLCHACSYRPTPNAPYTQAQWRVGGDGCTLREFQPSNNIAPTDTLPVLVEGSHIGEAELRRVLTPMRWGLVPYFYKGALNDMRLSTFNARSEEFLNKNMFSRPFDRRQRCALVCTGYYEWSRLSETGRAPYFVHSDSERPDIFAETELNQLGDTETKWWNASDGWSGPKLTMIAGLFERWTDKSGARSETLDSHRNPIQSQSPSILTFTVLTQEASGSMARLHSRMPVFLRTEQQVEAWLHSDCDSSARALDIIEPNSDTVFYSVAPSVGNSRNKDVSLRSVPVSRAHPEKNNRSGLKRSAKFMESWLGTTAGKKSRAENENEVV